MSAKTNHWKLGLFVFLCIGLLITGLVFFGVQRLKRPVFKAYVYLDESVDGLDIGAPVKFRGIKIGEVVQVRPAADQMHIEVTSNIYQDVMSDLGLRSPTELEEEDDLAQLERVRVQLVSSFLTGLSYLQTDFFDPELYPAKSYPFATKSPMIDSIPSTMRRIESGLGETLRTFPEILLEFRSVMNAVRGQLDGLDLPVAVAKAGRLVDALERRVAGLDDMPLVKNATAGFVEMESALAALRDPEGPFQELLVRLDQAVVTADQELRQAELPATTASFRDTSDELRRLSQTMRAQVGQLDRAIASVRGLADMLQRDPGALLRGKSATSPGK